MLSWKVFGLVALVLVAIFNTGIAIPVGSEHYSVEEHDPAEQTVNVNDKEYEADKPLYELQLAVWPDEDEQIVSHHHHHQVMADAPTAPVFEEQEIAYPVLTPQQDDHDDGHVVNTIPTWHHRPTTKRPVVQNIQTTKEPVQVVPTAWQHVSTTIRPSTQEIPVWHNPANNVDSQQPAVVNVPVWQPEPIPVPVTAPVSVPASIPVPTAAPVPAPPQQQHSAPQNDMPALIFPDIHFEEAEAIADQQSNDDVLNDHLLVGGVQPIPSKHKPTKRPMPHVEVIEQYQTVSPNGTTEYKLVLSNGMTNYKKIYNKMLPSGKIVTVQEGYDSVPIPGDDPYSNDYQTQYYIADEYGHNVYRVEKHTRRPKLPSHLNYKEQGGQF